jgi:hypothetical protein
LVIGNRILDVKIPQNTWTEINLGTVSMDRGNTRLKWIIKQGTVDLDWLNITEQGQQPVTLGGVSKPNGG